MQHVVHRDITVLNGLIDNREYNTHTHTHTHTPHSALLACTSQSARPPHNFAFFGSITTQLHASHSKFGGLRTTKCYIAKNALAF